MKGYESPSKLKLVSLVTLGEGTPWLGGGADELVKTAEAAGSTASLEAAQLAELGSRSVRRCFEAWLPKMNWQRMNKNERNMAWHGEIIKNG